MNNKTVFDYIFGEGFQYMVENVETHSYINLMHTGDIRGDVKNMDMERMVDVSITETFAPYFFVLKNHGKYSVFSLWSNNNSKEREEMQSNSFWFFTLLKELLPQGIIIKTEPARGKNVSSWIRKASDVQKYVDNHKNSKRYTPGSRFIRIKLNGSRFAVYEIFKRHFSSVIKDLENLDIDYKVLE